MEHFSNLPAFSDLNGRKQMIVSIGFMVLDYFVIMF